MSKVSQVVEVFKNSLDMSNEYSVKDLLKGLETSYKDVYGKSKTKKSGGEKKPASAYNIFIKEEIAKIKIENQGNANADPKCYMKIAAGRWKEHKMSLEDSK